MLGSSVKVEVPEAALQVVEVASWAAADYAWDPHRLVAVQDSSAAGLHVNTAAGGTQPDSIVPPVLGYVPAPSERSVSPSACCKVEDCWRLLRDEKPYYQRFGVCEGHMRSLALTVDGALCRFCQQCAKFEPVEAFDGSKRSCRARLLEHNRRRRKMGVNQRSLRKPHRNSASSNTEGRGRAGARRAAAEWLTDAGAAGDDEDAEADSGLDEDGTDGTEQAQQQRQQQQQPAAGQPAAAAAAAAGVAAGNAVPVEHFVLCQQQQQQQQQQAGCYLAALINQDQLPALCASPNLSELMTDIGLDMTTDAETGLRKTGGDSISSHAMLVQHNAAAVASMPELPLPLGCGLGAVERLSPVELMQWQQVVRLEAAVHAGSQQRKQRKQQQQQQQQASLPRSLPKLHEQSLQPKLQNSEQLLGYLAGQTASAGAAADGEGRVLPGQCEEGWFAASTATGLISMPGGYAQANAAAAEAAGPWPASSCQVLGQQGSQQLRKRRSKVLVSVPSDALLSPLSAQGSGSISTLRDGSAEGYQGTAAGVHKQRRQESTDAAVTSNKASMQHKAAALQQQGSAGRQWLLQQQLQEQQLQLEAMQAMHAQSSTVQQQRQQQQCQQEKQQQQQQPARQALTAQELEEIEVDLELQQLLLVAQMQVPLPSLDRTPQAAGAGADAAGVGGASNGCLWGTGQLLQQQQQQQQMMVQQQQQQQLVVQQQQQQQLVAQQQQQHMLMQQQVAWCAAGAAGQPSSAAAAAGVGASASAAVLPDGNQACTLGAALQIAQGGGLHASYRPADACMRLSVKLHNATPSQLQPGMHSQLSSMLGAAGAAVESGFMRPGCVHLILQVRAPLPALPPVAQAAPHHAAATAAAAASSAAAGALSRVVAELDGSDWARALLGGGEQLSVTVQLPDQQAVLVRDGVVTRTLNLQQEQQQPVVLADAVAPCNAAAAAAAAAANGSAHALCRLDGLVPGCISSTSLGAHGSALLLASGTGLSGPGTCVLARMQGMFLPAETCSQLYSRCSSDAGCVGVRLRRLQPYGLVHVEFQQGLLLSQAKPLLVVDSAEVAAELQGMLRCVQQAGDVAAGDSSSSMSRPEAEHVLIDFGRLLDFRAVVERHRNSGALEQAAAVGEQLAAAAAAAPAAARQRERRARGIDDSAHEGLQALAAAAAQLLSQKFSLHRTQAAQQQQQQHLELQQQQPHQVLAVGLGSAAAAATRRLKDRLSFTQRLRNRSSSLDGHGAAADSSSLSNSSVSVAPVRQQQQQQQQQLARQQRQAPEQAQQREGVAGEGEEDLQLPVPMQHPLLGHEYISCMMDVGVRLLCFLVDRGLPASAQMVLDTLLSCAAPAASFPALARAAAGCDGLGLLHRAVRSGSTATVLAVMAWGVQHQRCFAWDAPGPAGLTPLHLAALLGKQERPLAAMVLQCSPGLAAAWFSAKADDGATPATFAAMTGLAGLNRLAHSLLQQQV
ncbi:hypothetical protein COO60DRAFT_1635691 [Scenedesmus sp. NREL 46B-D3]|nr:hypothetical protein COO60DRAFT_1635691 [Scenedesmus sp. NREL 46B-D3]